MTQAALLTHIGFGLCLFAVSALMTRAMIALNISDIPNHRSSHDRPTPKSGGLAVAITFFLGLVTLYFESGSVRLSGEAFTAYLVIAGALVIIGLADDLFELRPVVKLLGQVAIALAFVGFVSTVSVFPLPGVGTPVLGPFGPLGTALWIVAVMNFVNFMDGINGLVSGVTIIAALELGVMAALGDAPTVYFGAIVLAAATLGFFVFNFPGGRIFLGDTGSQFLGFVMASLAVIGATSEGGHIDLFVVPCLLFPLLFDAVLTVVLRWRRGARLAEAHREHLYQILTRAGWSHARVSGVYFMLTVLSGGGALAAQALGSPNGLLGLLALIPFFAGFAVWVYRYGRRHGVTLSAP